MADVGKVLLAFSGGIDSSYCVGKLRAEGYHVEGLILDMTRDTAFVREASARAESLGLPCRVLDVSREFSEKVTGYFTDEYLRGRTPAPCTVCNPLIKWHHLYQTAVRDGFGRIATGHYFRLAKRDGHLYIRKAVDPVKDQSYYLWMLPQEILSMALTPMGCEVKKEIMNSEAEQPRESMGVCFLKNRDYRDFIKETHPGHPSVRPGPIKDECGVIIGRHDGAALYTTGQKKGLALPPGYSVTGIDAGHNTLIAGTKEKLFAHTLILENYCLAPGYSSGDKKLQTVIRGYGVNPEGNCSVKEQEGQLHVTLENPAWAPAKGQPAVIYDDELVVGGGFIQDYR